MCQLDEIRRQRLEAVATAGADRDPFRGPERPTNSLRGAPASRIARALVDRRPPWRMRELAKYSATSLGSTARTVDFLAARREDPQARRAPRCARGWPQGPDAAEGCARCLLSAQGRAPDAVPDGLELLLAHDVSAGVTRTAIDHLRRYAATPEGQLCALAGRAEEGVGDPALVSALSSSRCRTAGFNLSGMSIATALRSRSTLTAMPMPLLRTPMARCKPRDRSHRRPRTRC